MLKKKINKSIILNIAQNRSYSINQIAYTIRNILKYRCNIINNTKYSDGAQLKQLSDKNFKKKFKKFKLNPLTLQVTKKLN